MLNRVVLIGRLTKDPELRYTQSGVAISQFTLAVDRGFKNAQGNRETDFIPIKAFKGLAENCGNYLTKGKLAAVDGRIQVNSWTDQQGQKRWSTEVVAEDVRFLSPKDAGNTGNTGDSQLQPTGTNGFGHEVPFSLDDDIPF
ncbi:single-stranded DNA-binding protein A [Peptococcaceae bacterium CEB3]|nr:single-stranded DNA-binding protein A [Peptococcaceae bacterium CEB3]